MEDIKNIVIGQRWISEMEPELGIGTIRDIKNGKVHLFFSTSNVVRQYSPVRAPIQRFRLNTGDMAISRENISFEVTKIEENNGLLYYKNNEQIICETELTDNLTFNTPEKRLFAGSYDKNNDFNMRYQTLQVQHERLSSTVRGLCGARVQLIKHQLYIAREIAKRYYPRLMLADEVGLGKTIEASLILNRLIITNRASRILILVPEHLVLQWFCELYHRFNITSTIIDSKYYNSIDQYRSDINPFEEQQQIICSYELFTRNPDAQSQILESDWDVTVIDEAHHIKDETEEYDLLKELSVQTKGLILLTAVPEYGGMEHFFARLHLIDPHRYHDFQTFFWEMDNYHFVAALADKIISNKKLSQQDHDFLIKSIPEEYYHHEIIQDNTIVINEKTQKYILDYLIDQHGLGRIIFRNTRKNIPDFPRRKINLVGLTDNNYPGLPGDVLYNEFLFDCDRLPKEPLYQYDRDKRIEWLCDFLKNNTGEKVLVICRSKSKVLHIKKALLQKGFDNLCLFHEDMDIITRDKNAAWFSEANGAQLLISSEIGSEGRNFQFCNHLVFIDIPFDPELLEQRIGRLDRIGQKNVFHLHIPYIEGSPQETLIHWMHRGLDAFAKTLQGVNPVFNTYGNYIMTMALERMKLNDHYDADLDKLITDTKKFHKKIIKDMENSRDKLLELNSYNPEVADHIQKQIEEHDRDETLEYYLNDFFEYIGIKQSLTDERSYHLTPGHLKTDAFPYIEEHGLTITFDRERAIKREDIAFITADHPIIDRATELILGTSEGNAVIALLYGNTNKEPEILLEIVFILECIAPVALNIERYLSPVPVRVVINHKNEHLTDAYPFDDFTADLHDIDGMIFDKIKHDLYDHARPMIQNTTAVAQREAAAIIAESKKNMHRDLEGELKRLQILKKVNKNIHDQELLCLQDEIASLDGYLDQARLRIDAMRFIWHT